MRGNQYNLLKIQWLCLMMCMNGDQKGRARKMVAVLWGSVSPALSGALCAALYLRKVN